MKIVPVSCCNVQLGLGQYIWSVFLNIQKTSLMILAVGKQLRYYKPNKISLIVRSVEALLLKNIGLNNFLLLFCSR